MRARRFIRFFGGSLSACLVVALLSSCLNDGQGGSLNSSGFPDSLKGVDAEIRVKPDGALEAGDFAQFKVGARWVFKFEYYFSTDPAHAPQKVTITIQKLAVDSVLIQSDEGNVQVPLHEIRYQASNMAGDTVYRDQIWNMEAIWAGALRRPDGSVASFSSPPMSGQAYYPLDSLTKVDYGNGKALQYTRPRCGMCRYVSNVGLVYSKWDYSGMGYRTSTTWTLLEFTPGAP